MRAAVLALLLVASGCSKILGFDGFTQGDLGDDTPPDDGSTIDTPTGSMVRISGTILGSSDITQPATPVTTAVVQYFDRDGTMHEEVATNAAGAYTLDLSKVNGNVDGFLHVTDSAWIDAYVHFPRALTADAMLQAGLFTNTSLDQLATAGGTTHDVTAATVLLIVRTAADAPLAGATVSLDAACTTGSCGVLVYTDAQGRPDAALTVTSSAGLAYVFSVPEGGYTPFAVQADTFGDRYYNIGNASMAIITLTQP